MDNVKLNLKMREKGSSPSSDTTLLKMDVHQNKKRTKRKIVEDKLITPQIFDMLVTKIYTDVENIYAIKQKDVINILKPLHISNKTIARVINTVVPYAKATQGSVASMIRFLDTNSKSGQQQMVNMLIKELEEDLK